MKGTIYEILTKLHRESHKVSYAEACEWLGIEPSFYGRDFLLSSDEFRHLAMKADSEKGTEIREYYTRIEALFYEGLRGNTTLRIARGKVMELDLDAIREGVHPLPKKRHSRYVKKYNGKLGNANSMKRTPAADRLIIEIYERRNNMSVADVHSEYNKKAPEMDLPALSYGTIYYYIKSLELYKQTIKSIQHGKIN